MATSCFKDTTAEEKKEEIVPGVVVTPDNKPLELIPKDEVKNLPDMDTEDPGFKCKASVGGCNQWIDAGSTAVYVVYSNPAAAKAPGATEEDREYDLILYEACINKHREA